MSEISHRHPILAVCHHLRRRRPTLHLAGIMVNRTLYCPPKFLYILVTQTERTCSDSKRHCVQHINVNADKPCAAACSTEASRARYAFEQRRTSQPVAA